MSVLEIVALCGMAVALGFCIVGIIVCSKAIDRIDKELEEK